jgi:hypothetical protein
MSSQPTNHDAARLAATNRLTEASRDHPANHQLGEAIQEEARQRGQRYTVQEAAEVLGTSVDAVRGRIRRGTLDSLKVDGVVYVLLDSTNQERQSDKTTTDADEKRQQTGDQSELVAELRGQIDWLRREVERKDTILMQMAQRIPELEPAREEPREPQEVPVSSSEETDKGRADPEQKEPTQRRSFWRQFFGLQ